MVRQAAEAQQLTGLPAGLRVPAVPTLLPRALGPVENCVTLSTGQRTAADVLGDLGIGVDLSEHRAICRLPGPQDQPSGLDAGREERGHGAVSVSSVASGGQANRTGAYGEVPMPAETCSQDALAPPPAG
jgi:hypothetical protein